MIALKRGNQPIPDTPPGGICVAGPCLGRSGFPPVELLIAESDSSGLVARRPIAVPSYFK